MFPEFFRAFLGLVRDALCRHAKLMAENAVLRQQVIVLRRSAPRPRLKPRDRWTIAALTRISPGLLEAVAIVRQETIIRWHRSLWRLSGVIDPSDLWGARPSMRIPEQ
jgi:putative transposase